nr:hypothetical protein [uncultured Massilia sp.]
MFFDTACNILGGVVATAALCPCLAWLKPGSSTADKAMLRHALGLALLVCVIAAGARTGWTFFHHGANVVAVCAAFGAAALLALFVFSMRPRWVALSLGGLCVVAWLFAVLLTFLVSAFEGNSAAVADLGGGMYCRVSVYGSAAADSGEDIELFERHGLLDYLRISIRQSAVHPEGDAALGPGLMELATFCRARVEEQRGRVVSARAVGPRQ